jgi:hypothetical protein
VTGIPVSVLPRASEEPRSFAPRLFHVRLCAARSVRRAGRIVRRAGPAPGARGAPSGARAQRQARGRGVRRAGAAPGAHGAHANPRLRPTPRQARGRSARRAWCARKPAAAADSASGAHGPHARGCGRGLRTKSRLRAHILAREPRSVRGLQGSLSGGRRSTVHLGCPPCAVDRPTGGAGPRRSPCAAGSPTGGAGPRCPPCAHHARLAARRAGRGPGAHHALTMRGWQPDGQRGAPVPTMRPPCAAGRPMGGAGPGSAGPRWRPRCPGDDTRRKPHGNPDAT